MLLPFGGSPWSLGLGLALIAGGQTLNLSVFYRLGKVGVFTAIDLTIRFPGAGGSLLIVQTSAMCRHSALHLRFLSRRGLSPRDWYLLPLLETGYCTLSAYFER